MDASFVAVLTDEAGEVEVACAVDMFAYVRASGSNRELGWR